MQIIYATADEFLEKVPALIQEREDGLVVNFGDKFVCARGKNANIRKEVCEELGIPILNAHYLGGAIVVFPGDLSIMEVKKGHSRLGEKVIKQTRDFLQSKGLPVRIQGNDLLLADLEARTWHKVGSYGSNWVDDMTETAIHISITMDLDLVKRICLKEMVKVPGELGSHGITAEELWQVILDGLDYD